MIKNKDLQPKKHLIINPPVINYSEFSKTKEEKENLKSMLKSEFGLFQSDTAVKTFQKVNQPKETIEIDFGEEPSKEEIEKLKKEGKFAKWKKKMEEENKNKTEFEFE